MTPRMTLLTTVAATTLTIASAGLAQEVTLTMLIPTDPATVATTDALTAAYTELHPEVTFEIDSVRAAPKATT